MSNAQSFIHLQYVSEYHGLSRSFGLLYAFKVCLLNMLSSGIKMLLAPINYKRVTFLFEMLHYNGVISILSKNHLSCFISHLLSLSYHLLSHFNFLKYQFLKSCDKRSDSLIVGREVLYRAKWTRTVLEIVE